jgi:hypothetical protein
MFFATRGSDLQTALCLLAKKIVVSRVGIPLLHEPFQEHWGQRIRRCHIRRVAAAIWCRAHQFSARRRAAITSPSVQSILAHSILTKQIADKS